MDHNILGGDQMKKNKIVTALFIVLLTGTACLGIWFQGAYSVTPESARAATKNKISCSVKNGTLTLSGKGAVSSSQIKSKNTNSIKKIVVKNGITSLPKWAFHKFGRVKEIVIAGSVKKIGQEALPNSQMLKKVTMPGTFQLVTEEGDDAVYELEGWKSKWINTICFNTPLSLKTLSYVKSRNLIVSKNDKKYKSIDGVIYSKDGKSIVRVPAYRESLTVEDGCEEFCIQSVVYAQEDYESDAYLMCGRLKKITLPDSVKTVNASKYFSVSYDSSNVKELTIKTDQLDSKSILLLLNKFRISDEKSFLKQFDYVSVRDDGMCINQRDSCLLLYTGTADQVTILDGVKIIGGQAFYGTKIKSVVIPDTVTEIEQAAFMSCEDLADVRLPVSLNAMGTDVFNACEKLDHVTFPNGMTEVPESTFEDCGGLKDITLPDTVTTIRKAAFAHTSVPASILLQGNIKEIQNNAFSATGWNELVLPATVEKVDSYAFSMPSLERVRVCGSTAGIYSQAFCSYWSDSKDTTLVFEKGVEEWQTGLTLRERGSSYMEFKWQKITGIDGWQIQVSPYKSFQKKKKTYYAKKEKMSMKLTDKKMVMNYVRIRPYKTVNGKRSYGRWAMDTFKNN